MSRTRRLLNVVFAAAVGWGALAGFPEESPGGIQGGIPADFPSAFPVEFSSGQAFSHFASRVASTGRLESRPLPPRAAGEEDWQLETRPPDATRPLPPCVAGESDFVAMTLESDDDAPARPSEVSVPDDDAPAKPEPPAAPEPATTTPENAPDDETNGEPRSVVLPENGELRRKLDKVRAQIAGERFSDAARELGQLLQDPTIQDFFLNRDEQRRGGRGFLAEVRRLLKELPPAGQSAYRTQFEALARGRLNAALSAGGESGLREVAARFPETKAGNDALLHLAVYLRDHGRDQAAVACLKRMSFRPDAVADEERWTNFVSKFASTTEPSPSRTGGGITFRGGPARNAAVPAQAPFLTPRWSRPATGDTHSQLALDAAWQMHRQGHTVSLPMPSPLAAGDLVFVRTPRGVAAFDFDTGKRRWNCPSNDDSDNAGLEHILWSEPAGGSFAVDDDCVYFLDNVRVESRDESTEESSDESFEEQSAVWNQLVCYEHSRQREGNLRWQVGGQTGGAEPRLAGAFFLGPPLAWQGSLYILAESRSALSLQVLDRATGRLKWSRELAVVERKISEDLFRRTIGVTPSISAEEIIVCPTSGGALIAVDLTTQSLLWAYRYPRDRSPVKSVTKLGDTIDLDDVDEHIGQSNRWLDGTVAIQGRWVVATPPESQKLHCLDLESGQPLWTADRNQGLFVAGVSNDRIVVTGRYEMRALRPETGAVAWTLNFPGHPAATDTPPPLKPPTGESGPDATISPVSAPPTTPPVFPAGRGVFAGERYFLPVTSAAIWELDLTAGTLLAEYKSPRETALGNLVWRDGRFVSYGPQGLEVFDEHESLAGEVANRLQHDPRDADALLRKGDLALATPGRLTDALDSFRTAHRLAPSPRTKSRLISALLDARRQHPAGSDQYSAELDDLIGP